MHEVGGYVFLIITDNLSVNQKIQVRRSILSDHNPIFDTLFTLYDMPHCFKNIRNNWVTEPSQTLEFVEPVTQKVHQAKWKDLVQIYQ